MKQSTFIVLLSFLILGCTSVEKEQVMGSWQAVEITEDGEPLGVNPQEIKLTFRAPDRYSYQSTLKYREAGTFDMDNKYLYTIDTIHQASSRKAVEILLISEDSLHLKMMENGQERVLKMVKER